MKSDLQYDADTDLVEIPGGPFLLGASYPHLPKTLRINDQKKCLGLGAVLAATPPHWVDLPAFSIQSKLVSNGQYYQFWSSLHPDDPQRFLIDDPEIWQFVWDQHPLHGVRVPASEPGVQLSEDYSSCINAADALLLSYSYEAQRLLIGHHVPAMEPGFDERSRALVRIFVIARCALAAGMNCEPPELAPTVLELAQEDELFAHDLSTIMDLVNERYFGTQAKAPLQVILRRLQRWHLSSSDTLLPSDLLRPLSWPDDITKALQEGRGLFRSAVPFSELPVVGVSLYEASAYAAWMRLQTGMPYVLPSEAEWEKAFSWPVGESALDESLKVIFPWQEVNDFDFNQWFSREGHRVEQMQKRAAGYKKLLQDTARRVGDAYLYQGLGFGWQWTRERFNELERKYNRFTHVGWLQRQEAGKNIYEYQDCNDHSCRYVTVRGAPDQLGGPGTVTRRFALSPLRGSAECGFRCVVSSEGEL